MASSQATIRAGIPQTNSALYHAMQFSVGDPVALLELPGENGCMRSVCIVRDVELDRAVMALRVDEVSVPADYAPEGGLSADREVATAQAAAECLRREGVTEVIAHRTLPLSFAHVLKETGISVCCDLDMGVLERRRKTAEEIAMLRHSQNVTEEAIQLACEMVGRAVAQNSGILFHNGKELTSECVRAAVNIYLMGKGFSGPTYIIAGGPQGASCHHPGDGELRTGEPVIVDIFPTDLATHYCGDCTRTVVHGEIPPDVATMHAAVCAAKNAASAAVRAGVTGKSVHAATTEELGRQGFNSGYPPEGSSDSYCTMHHGTGHGIGLDVHEPPLLDASGIDLVEGDVLTIEPGLYRKDLGGVRVEDMVVVTSDGCKNLNRLPEGLTWQ